MLLYCRTVLWALTTQKERKKLFVVQMPKKSTYCNAPHKMEHAGIAHGTTVGLSVPFYQPHYVTNEHPLLRLTRAAMLLIRDGRPITVTHTLSSLLDPNKMKLLAILDSVRTLRQCREVWTAVVCYTSFIIEVGFFLSFFLAFSFESLYWLFFFWALLALMPLGQD